MVAVSVVFAIGIGVNTVRGIMFYKHSPRQSTIDPGQEEIFIELNRGVVRLSWQPGKPHSDWGCLASTYSPQLGFTPRLHAGNTQGMPLLVELELPFVYPWLLFASPTWIVHRRHKGARRSASGCPKCGYDLRGSAGDVCPECGTAKVISSPAAGARP